MRLWKPHLAPDQFAKLLALTEQFLLDAAVLIFVFPVLDTIILYGKQAVTRPLILWTSLVSGVFLAWAMFLGVWRTKLVKAGISDDD